MAQTKSKKGSTTRKSGSSRSKANGSGGSSGAKARSSSSRAKTGRKSTNGTAPNGVAGSVKRTVASGASTVASGASEIPPLARKAKVPLLASGAALVGVAGAVAATRSGRKRKVLGVTVPKRNGLKPDARKISEAVVDAAKRADQLGQRVSKVAHSVQSVGETANEVAKRT